MTDINMSPTYTNSPTTTTVTDIIESIDDIKDLRDIQKSIVERIGYLKSIPKGDINAYKKDS